MKRDSLFVQSGFQGIQLGCQLSRQLIAELLVELGDALGFLLPLLIIHIKNALQGFEAEVQALQVDILGIRNVTQWRFPARPLRPRIS